MTEVNGQPVIDIQMVSDTTGTFGSFTAPGPGTTKLYSNYRPGDRIIITGHGSPIVGIVNRVRWSPTEAEVEWIMPPMTQESADVIIDRAARYLATRRPA